MRVEIQPSVPEHLDDDLPRPPSCIELEQHHLLPRTQRQCSIDEWHGQRGPEQGGTDVTGPVVIAPALVMPVLAAGGCELISDD
jgi:hypothetical protein